MSAVAPGDLGVGEAAALDVGGLTAGYGRTLGLRDVTLIVPAGGVVALLGPNGAGKTTMLRAVSGLIPVNSGTVRLYGDDITGMRPHHRAVAGCATSPRGEESSGS